MRQVDRLSHFCYKGVNKNMAVNLYELGYMSDSVITEAEIAAQSYYSIYDAKQSSVFSFGGDIHKRIMESYAERREKDFALKFGKTPQEYLEESMVQQDIFESQKDFLRNLENMDVKFKKATSQARMSLDDLKKIKADADANSAQLETIINDIKNWEKTTQEYLDLMATVGDTFADTQQITTANISGQTPKGLAMSANALTSFEKASLLLEKTRENIEKIGMDVKKLKKAKLTTPVIRGGNLVKNKKTNRIRNDRKSLNTVVQNSMGGYISSIKDIIFEITVANALNDTANDLIEEVFMLGQADGITVKDRQGRQITSMKTSKTDVAYKDKKGFQVNLSLKNQKHNSGKPIKTSFLSTSLLQYLRMVGTTEESQKLLVAGFNSNSNFNAKTSGINIFLASLVADMAIGSGGADKIDFIVFNNGIMSLGDYYRNLTGKVSISVKIKNKDNINSILGAKGNIADVSGSLDVSVRD